jgi:hypothetical protein
MKIAVVSSNAEASQIRLIEEFDDLLLRDGYSSADCRDIDKKDGHIVIFPEATVVHPETLYKEILEYLDYHLKNDSDAYILTFSETVFSAIRYFVATNSFEHAFLYAFTNDELVETSISNAGDYYEIPGIFDNYDNFLMNILDIKMKCIYKP